MNTNEKFRLNRQVFTETSIVLLEDPPCVAGLWWFQVTKTMVRYFGNIETDSLTASWHRTAFLITDHLWGIPSVTGEFPSQWNTDTELWYVFVVILDMLLNIIWVFGDLKNLSLMWHHCIVRCSDSQNCNLPYQVFFSLKYHKHY